MGPSNKPTKGRVATTLVGIPVSGLFGIFAGKVLDRWGVLDGPANALGDYLKGHVSGSDLALLAGLFLALLCYCLLLLRVWRPRHIHHVPLQGEAQVHPTAEAVLEKPTLVPAPSEPPAETLTPVQEANKMAALAQMYPARNKSVSLSITPESQAALRELLESAFESIGMAIGSDAEFYYEEAIASMEPMFLALLRAGIQVPELRDDGPKLGTLRAHRYLNLIRAPLLIGDNEEARRRAAAKVELINAMPEDELWAHFDGLIDRSKAPTAAEQKMADPYRKAVLTIEEAKVTLSSNGERIVKCDCRMIFTSLVPLSECQVWLSRLEGHENVDISAFSRLGPIKNGCAERKFSLTPNQKQPVYLIKRDLADIISNPPFLLLTDKGDYPLADNAEYILRLALESEAKHPTLVTLRIRTGVAEDLTVEIIEQRV